MKKILIQALDITYAFIVGFAVVMAGLIILFLLGAVSSFLCNVFMAGWRFM
jgi:hypothetical protein